MTIKDAIKGYIEFLLSGRQISQSTQEKYQECFNTWIVPLLGSLDLDALTLGDVITLRGAMRRRNMSAARQYSVVMCLKGLLSYVRRVLKIDALDPGDIPLPDRGTPNVVYLSNDEIAKVINAIPIEHFSGLRLRALVELILATGLCISEALSLDREPFEAGVTQLEIVGKGKRTREVFFSERSRDWIMRFLRRRFDSNPALFVTTGIEPRRLQRADISGFFIELRKRSGIEKKLTPHVLRHTFCTHLLFNGADITYIRDLAGHRDIQTTAQYYIGKDKTVLRSVVEKNLRYEAFEQAKNESS